MLVLRVMQFRHLWQNCCRQLLDLYKFYTASRLNDSKTDSRCKWVFVVNKIFNIAGNDFDSKKSVCCNRTRFRQ